LLIGVIAEGYRGIALLGKDGMPGNVVGGGPNTFGLAC